MKTRRNRARLVLAACLAVACAGCSWLIGVSEDPVVVEYGPDGAPAERDATRADAAVDAEDEPADDAEADAPEDAEEDI